MRLGDYNFQKSNETRARDFHIIDIRQHIDFDETTFDNDISLLKIHSPVLINSYIWPVCMPPTTDTFEGYLGIVIGWGSQFFGGPNSDTLMEVSVPIWNQEDCQNVFIEHIGKQVLCAGGEERDSCQVRSIVLYHNTNVFLSLMLSFYFLRVILEVLCLFNYPINDGQSLESFLTV